MSSRLYETAETLVYDPIAANRNATRASLHTLGFRNIEFAASLEILNKQIATRMPDVILAEATGAENEICEMVQGIRQGRLGNNPFVVMIVTTWRRDGNIVGQVLNSGADDLLARPFSTTLLAERLRIQIERRKGFVVTSDYIGPDRRRDPSRFGIECVDVPNSLRIKTAGLSRDEADRQIFDSVRAARDNLNREKIRRNAFQVCVQWRMLEQRRPGAREFYEILSRMTELADEIKARAAAVKQPSAAQWCDAIADSARAICTMMELAKSRPDRMADLSPPMHLLGHGCMSLGQMFAPGEIEPSSLVELDELVARIDVRRQAGMSRAS